MKEKISMGMGVIMGILSYLLGGFDSLLTVFSIIILVDTVTGMLKAWNLGEYQSSKFRSGFVKKSGYLLGIILTVQIDVMLDSNGALRDAVLAFFVVNESFSIIENLGQMGVVFPNVLTNALKVLKEKDEIES